MNFVVALIKILGNAAGTAKAAGPALGVLAKVAGRVLSALYGTTASAAGKLNPVDVAHLLILCVSYFGTALTVSSMVLSDVASALAWVAAGLAAFVTTVHKWSSEAPKALPPKS